MFGRHKIPKWVEALPEGDSNKELLIKIARASQKPLETPREVVFGIKDIKGIDAAQNIEIYCSQQGWKCEITEDHRVGGFYWLEAKRDDYVLSAGIIEDEQFFIRLAHMQKALYDGWYASIV